MWIYGAGGFGRETMDACLAAGLVVEGFLDDGAVGEAAGRPVRSVLEVDPAELVIAIADPGTRLRLQEEVVRAGWTPVTVVDPRAVLGARSTVGEGSIVLARAFVSCDVTLGPAAHVNYGATIGHDTTSGAATTVLPGANVAGSVQLGQAVLVGSGAVVLQGLEVGDRAVVGAAAVVTRSVAPGTTVMGVPARERKPG